jgi:hypothetical protein
MPRQTRKPVVVPLTDSQEIVELKQAVSALKARQVYERDLRRKLVAMVLLIASPTEDGGVFPPTSMYIRGKLVMIREKLAEIEAAD